MFICKLCKPFFLSYIKYCPTSIYVFFLFHPHSFVQNSFLSFPWLVLRFSLFFFSFSLIKLKYVFLVSSINTRVKLFKHSLRLSCFHWGWGSLCWWIIIGTAYCAIAELKLKRGEVRVCVWNKNQSRVFRYCVSNRKPVLKINDMICILD